MLAYTTVGTNDLARAAAFYDELFAIVDGRRVYDAERGIGWSNGRGKPMFMVMTPFDGQPATVGNGVMVTLSAAHPAQVRELHARALALGGTCEGAPGLRGAHFYLAYFRDLDGNKLAAFALTPAA